MKTLRMACLAGVFCMMTGAAMIAQSRPLPMSDKVNVNLLGARRRRASEGAYRRAG